MSITYVLRNYYVITCSVMTQCYVICEHCLSVCGFVMMSKIVNGVPSNVVDFTSSLRPHYLTSNLDIHLRKHPHRLRPFHSSPTRLNVVAELNPTEPRESTIQQGTPLESGSLVLVAGATGGVGQLLTARLLDNDFRVRAICRDRSKAEALFGTSTVNLEIMECDFRDETRISEVLQNVDVVCSCLGTTAFPSSRWENHNSPEMTDRIAIGNLMKQTSEQIKRFILVSSVGVTRFHQFPYSLLNLFKVLTYRRMSEENLMDSGLPYTIIRPCRLTDGPYTSYDLNTLIKGTRGGRRSVQISDEDDLSGEASRIVVAEAIVQCLHLPATMNHVYSLASVKQGIPPEQDTQKWSTLFESC